MGAFNFFSKKNSYHASYFLLNHYLKDQYFYRLMQFQQLDDNTIYALDTNQPRLITFDPWPQTIFLYATGKRTVHQFIIEMAMGYRKAIPPLLEQTVIEETERLIKEKIIAISNEKIDLDVKFLNAVNYK